MRVWRAPLIVCVVCERRSEGFGGLKFSEICLIKKINI